MTSNNVLDMLPRMDPEQHRAALIKGEDCDLSARKISTRTCKAYDYYGGTYRGQKAQFANYRNELGVIVMQHVRYGDKQFSWNGRIKGDKPQLFGQHMGSQGTLILCEGEIDCMSVHEVLVQHRVKGRHVCASIPDGAQSATRAVKNNISWIEGFSRVVVFFDQDEPGRKAAGEVAMDIGPAKARVVKSFAYKDANEALVAGDEIAIKEALNNAVTLRPDNIIHAPDLLKQVLEPEKRFGLPFPWEGWNHYMNGLRPGEVCLIAAGTGIGKSLFSRSIALYWAKSGVKVAYLGLEESCVNSLERMLSEEMGCNPAFHLDTEEQRRARDPKVIEDALSRFAENVYLIDQFGGDDIDKFCSQIRHYVLAEGAEAIFLDHFSMLADGISLGADQRRSIDKAIKQLKVLAKELEIRMVIVCHLSRGNGIGPNHEEGGEPNLAQLRGSNSLGQYCDFVVMLQRNPKAEDPAEANQTTCWMKKNRLTGQQGLMCKLQYLSNSRFQELMP